MCVLTNLGWIWRCLTCNKTENSLTVHKQSNSKEEGISSEANTHLEGQNIPSLFITRMFIAVFTRACLWALLWVWWSQSISHPAWLSEHFIQKQSSPFYKNGMSWVVKRYDKCPNTCEGIFNYIKLSCRPALWLLSTYMVSRTELNCKRQQVKLSLCLVN
jgi:hypothetical protein